MNNNYLCVSPEAKRDLRVPYIPSVDNPSEVPSAFASAGMTYRCIDCVNWPEAYPYRPEVRFAIAHSGDRLYIHYKVKEQGVLAAGSRDKDHVWEDSCVEFFCAPGEDNTYINLEANCIGSVYSCIGSDRHGRTFIPDRSYASIRRWASLDGPIDPERREETEWELALIVPSSVYGIDNLSGRTLRGNFYKCGDKLSVPHFLSWAPIGTPKPDFHCPEYFVKLFFE